jgi:hypothetical protein
MPNQPIPTVRQVSRQGSIGSSENSGWDGHAIERTTGIVPSIEKLDCYRIKQIVKAQTEHRSRAAVSE